MIMASISINFVKRFTRELGKLHVKRIFVPVTVVKSHLLKCCCSYLLKKFHFHVSELSGALAAKQRQACLLERVSPYWITRFLQEKFQMEASTLVLFGFGVFF